MYIFKIHDTEYRVRFTYRQLCNDDLLDKITGAMTDNGEETNTPRSVFRRMAETCAELLLAGLQKYHSKEFGYKSDETKRERIEQLIDWFDDYEDESTPEHAQSAATLFTDLQDELGKNGFLSVILRATPEQTETENQETANVTEFPTPHTENE